MSESIDILSESTVNGDLVDFAYTVLDDYLDNPYELYSTTPFSKLEGLFAIDPDAYAFSWECPHLYINVELGESTLKAERAYMSVGRQTDMGNEVHIFVDGGGVIARREGFGEYFQLSDEQARNLLDELVDIKGMLVKLG